MLPVSFSIQLTRTMLAAVLWSAAALAAFAGDTNTSAGKPSAPPAKSSTPAATNAAPVEIPIPQSVFVIPQSRGDGVDPFFPLSTRLQPAAPSNSTNKTAAAGELVIKGFSGTPAHPLVILNDRTFGAGDENEVATAQGRARVRCIEINLKDESTIIEVNGQRRELRFRRGK
jgi:hypothetical protein